MKTKQRYWRGGSFRRRALWLTAGFAIGLGVWSNLIERAAAYDWTAHTNQVGYHTHAPKTVLMTGMPEGSKAKFYLYDPGKKGPVPLLKGKPVYSMRKVHIYPAERGDGPQLAIWVLDFSDFQKAGTYELRKDGDPSFKIPVKISDFVYWDTMKTVLHTFYYQRCGQNIVESAPGEQDSNSQASNALIHADCHDQDGIVKPYDKNKPFQKDTAGGWHDGSDYNKYLTPTGLTLAHLMSLYEARPKLLNTLSLEYPVNEPDLGGVPDYLHEISVGIDWLLSMQRMDGAFYRKVASDERVGNILPASDDSKRYVYGVTTQDTAVGAATLAMAARVYYKKDLGYAVKCLLAAENAWSYLASHPVTVESSPDDTLYSPDYLENPAGFPAYRLWAAAELYLSTGKQVYLNAIKKQLPTLTLNPITWHDPALQGLLDYCLYAREPDVEITAFVKEHLKPLADDALHQTASDPFLGFGDSKDPHLTESILTRALLLLNAHQLISDTPQQQGSLSSPYLKAAVENLNFVLGQNPHDQIFITGLGPHAVQHLEQPLLLALNKTLPGYLADSYDPELIKMSNEPPRRHYRRKALPPLVVYPQEHLLNNALLVRVLGLCNQELNPVDFEAPSANHPADNPLDVKIEQPKQP